MPCQLLFTTTIAASSTLPRFQSRPVSNPNAAPVERFPALSLASRLAVELPYLRRYARALSGSQRQGDALVAATLEAIAADRLLLPDGVPLRLALFKAFKRVWMAAPADPVPRTATDDHSPAAIVSARLAVMAPLARQALLLSAMEGFAEDAVGYLIDRPPAEVQALIAQALADIARQTRTQVLIIEDEPIIAADIAAIVDDLGHGVIGVATTHREAVAMLAAHAPGLVLADIQLRDGSSGVEAVREILARQPVPAIFITGFPERLLTGERPEPTFLITKPFQPASVRAAIGQAILFNPTGASHG